MSETNIDLRPVDHDGAILTFLARKHGSDKIDGHYYTQHYHKHFSHLTKLPINMLEIGVGGYNDPNKGGSSLRMWQDYFTNGKIHGIDIYDKSAHESERIKIYRGSQNDPDFLRSVVKDIGTLHLVIDDGSHINNHVITTFQTLFPLLPDGAIYAIEDVQTSYWRNEGGDSYNLNRPNTIMGYFKMLVDGLNHEESDNPFRETTYLDRHIKSITFYHNLIFLVKGKNEEGSIANRRESNYVALNKRRMSHKLRYIFSRIRHLLGA